MYAGNKKKVILLNSLLIIYSIIFQSLIINKFLKYSSSINAAFMVIILSVAIGLIGIRKDSKTDLKINILYKTIALVLIFFIVIYAFGIVIGFNNNAYSRNPIILFNNVFAPIILIVCVEVFRYIIINSVNKNSILIKITTFALTIFEILININCAKLIGLLSLFKITATKIIPIICKNLVMTSLCIYGGVRSTIFYRLVMDTYIYFVPIIPNFSEYIESILGICFPFILYMYIISDLHEDMGEMKLKSFKEDFSAWDTVVLTCIICLAVLLSGFFPFVLIGIGSGSMSPMINKGDALIYRKVSNDRDIKEGDILVFKNGNKVIVHRLVEKKMDNNNVFYITKGDANNSIDDIDIKIDDIKGIVVFKIKYIAYPSIWFNELLNKRS